MTDLEFEMTARKAPRPLVVKFGGSLVGTPALRHWIEALDQYAGPLIVVPGGGGFADAVRAIQKTMMFDDDAAHHIAMVAMEQYGLALASLWPRLEMTESLSAIARALRMGRVAGWAPATMALAAPLPKSWDVTSDTLSAWLAAQVRADRLLLVKNAALEKDTDLTLADLAASGLVDRLFPHFAAASGADIFVAGPNALPGAAAKFISGELPGLAVRRA
jgi:5-(aminomethyl)-3-furanmethanol phosphate kinase